MADVEIKYNNSTIASLNDSGTEVLETKGTFLTDDITVEYTKSGGGGGSSSYELLYRTEAVASTTSTSASLLTTISGITRAWTKDKILYVRIRDKAGKRAGYFFGSDDFLINYVAASGTTNMQNVVANLTTKYNGGVSAWTTKTNSVGVYLNSVNSSGNINIYQRYSSSSSGTIDGTYIIEVYLLDFPGNVSPFA